MPTMAFLVLWVLVCQLLPGNQVSTAERERCFVAPSEEVLAVTVSQPDCPIEFVNAYCVGLLKGGSQDVYRIRNRSRKPIKAYSIAIVNSEGTEGSHSITITVPQGYFKPGQVRSNDDDLEITPLTDELRERYKLKGQMRVVKIFIVVRVELADGSEYSAEREYKSLKAFFEKYAIDADNGDGRKVKRQ